MNVIGSVPDGWWEDRQAAMRKLVERLDRYSIATGDDVTVVFDARPFELPDVNIEVRFAPGGPDAADHTIVEIVHEAPDPETITVATSDRRLEAEVRSLGADVRSARSFRRRAGLD